MKKGTTAKKETVKSTKGKTYVVDLAKGTAKIKPKVLVDNLAALAEADLDVQEVEVCSMQVYMGYLRENGFVITQQRDYFNVKGYKVSFGKEGMVVTDNMQFGKLIEFENVLTPRELKEFLDDKPNVRTFSPVEMREATERGKLLQEKRMVPVEALPEIISTNDLMEQKKKALRLINRIEKKQTDSSRLITEVPLMIDFRRLKCNLTLLVNKYKKRELRWPAFVKLIKERIEAEDFIPTPEKAPKFTGLEMPNWNYLTYDEIDVVLDGKTKMEKGKFLVKHLLRRDMMPEMMPQMMKFLQEKISIEEFVKTPIAKDAFQGYDEKLLDNLSTQQARNIERMFYAVEVHNPLMFMYSGLDKGAEILVFFEASAMAMKGKVVEVKQGIQVRYEDGTVEPMFKNNRFDFIIAKKK